MSDPRKALMTVRIIWVAMLMGQLTFAAIAVGIVTSAAGEAPGDAASVSMLFIISCAMIVTAIPVGLFVRGQVFKRHWQGDIVTPRGYAGGNIIAFASCEGPVFFSLIVCLIARSFWPYAIPAAAGLVVFLLLWPSGKPMFSPRDADADNPYRQLR